MGAGFFCGHTCAECAAFFMSLMFIPVAVVSVIFSLLMCFVVAGGGFMTAIPDEEMTRSSVMAIVMLVGSACLMLASGFDVFGGSGFLLCGCCACASDEPPGCRRRLIDAAIVLRLLAICLLVIYCIMLGAVERDRAAKWDEDMEGYRHFVTDAMIMTLLTVSPLALQILVGMCIQRQLQAKKLAAAMSRWDGVTMTSGEGGNKEGAGAQWPPREASAGGEASEEASGTKSPPKSWASAQAAQDEVRSPSGVGVQGVDP